MASNLVKLLNSLTISKTFAKSLNVSTHSSQLFKQKPSKSLLLTSLTSSVKNFKRNVNFIQIGPNKFVKVKREPIAGTLISSDIEDSDTDSHHLTRKSSKTAVEFPRIVADSPFENDYENLYYAGVHFSELPIVLCRANWNNLVCHVLDSNCKQMSYTSLMLEGYRNAKKKSPVVNQQLGQIVARRTLKQGIKCVRVVLEGVGPGREPVVRGLFLGGLNIVSLTDHTHIKNYYYMRRPRKQRRV